MDLDRNGPIGASFRVAASVLMVSFFFFFFSTFSAGISVFFCCIWRSNDSVTGKLR